ncbi:MAG: hypothetical protein AAGG99_03685 [Pseudomonadota bacterium]
MNDNVGRYSRLVDRGHRLNEFAQPRAAIFRLETIGAAPLQDDCLQGCHQFQKRVIVAAWIIRVTRAVGREKNCFRDLIGGRNSQRLLDEFESHEVPHLIHGGSWALAAPATLLPLQTKLFRQLSIRRARCFSAELGFVICVSSS